MTDTQVKVKPLILLVGALFTQQAWASGYHFGTQSVNAQSTANAATAEAKNASTISSNPAGLAHLPNHQISGSITAVMPNIEYSNAKAEYFQGGDVEGSDSGKITPDVVPTPHLYGAYKINDKTTVGLGMYVPFGSETEYDRDSKLRYNLNKLGLKSVNIEPAVSFKINQKHTIGAGLIAQYTKANLRKYADWSASLDERSFQGAKALGRIHANATRKDFDGYSNVKGDDWGFGYHLGWMYDVNDRTRVGASYRSAIKHNLKGTSDWAPEGVIAQDLFNKQIGLARPEGTGYIKGEMASVALTTPESASIHAMHKATDKLNLFGDVTWTRHSRFKEAELQFEYPKRTANASTSNSTTINPNWRDTFKVAVGGSYQLSNPIQIRAGIAFDQSPVRDAEHRLNTLPDGNRIWYSAGIKYDFKKGHSLDIAYSHIHINDTSFVGSAANGNTVDSKGKTSANFKNYANIVGLQYTRQF